MAKANAGAEESKVKRFVEGVKAEFGKIIWPSKDKAIKQAIAVIVVSVIVGLLIVGVDLGSQRLIDLLLSL